MQVLERYFRALRTRDWDALASCLAADVRRSGPYADVIRGRQPYVEYLSKVISSLANYELKVVRIRALDARSAVVELSETVDMDGARREFPEVLLFDLDEQGLIAGIDIYLKQPPAPASPKSPASR